MHVQKKDLAPHQLLPRDADADQSVQDADGSRHGSVTANRLLHADGRLEVLGERHAMCNDGRLERHHGTAAARGAGQVGQRPFRSVRFEGDATGCSASNAFRRSVRQSGGEAGSNDGDNPTRRGETIRDERLGCI